MLDAATDLSSGRHVSRHLTPSDLGLRSELSADGPDHDDLLHPAPYDHRAARPLIVEVPTVVSVPDTAATATTRTPRTTASAPVPEAPADTTTAPAPGPTDPPAETVAPAPSQEPRMIIPSIGMDKAVYVGGQSSIDQGFATLYNTWGFANWPGGTGPVWIAAHRSTHGSPFAQIPKLHGGEDVFIDRLGVRWAYRVTEQVIVPGASDKCVITCHQLVLQTSWPNDRIGSSARRRSAVKDRPGDSSRHIRLARPVLRQRPREPPVAPPARIHRLLGMFPPCTLSHRPCGKRLAPAASARRARVARPPLMPHDQFVHASVLP